MSAVRICVSVYVYVSRPITTHTITRDEKKKITIDRVPVMGDYSDPDPSLFLTGTCIPFWPIWYKY